MNKVIIPSSNHAELNDPLDIIDEEEEDETLIDSLLDLMDDEEEREDINTEEQRQKYEKINEVQHKYYESLLEIFTKLDLTEIHPDGNNEIDLQQFFDYIQAKNLGVPLYLVQNIFYTIVMYDPNNYQII